MCVGCIMHNEEYHFCVSVFKVGDRMQKKERKKSRALIIDMLGLTLMVYVAVEAKLTMNCQTMLSLCCVLYTSLFRFWF